MPIPKSSYLTTRYTQKSELVLLQGHSMPPICSSQLWHAVKFNVSAQPRSTNTARQLNKMERWKDAFNR